MKQICRLPLWGLALALLSIVAPSEVSSSLVRQMTFEEVATQAKVIVLGRVSKIPEMAVYDRATHDVYRRNLIQVEEYLKGAGPKAEIEVRTFGGEFVTDGLGLEGPRIQFVQ